MGLRDLQSESFLGFERMPPLRLHAMIIGRRPDYIMDAFFVQPMASEESFLYIVHLTIDKYKMW